MEHALIEREAVTLDFTPCETLKDIYSEMRTKMNWKSWYGENLDALWDILSGMEFFGDDFKILRPRMYADPALTRRVDAVCDIFYEAQARFGKITVDVDYLEQ